MTGVASQRTILTAAQYLTSWPFLVLVALSFGLFAHVAAKSVRRGKLVRVEPRSKSNHQLVVLLLLAAVLIIEIWSGL